MRPHKVVCGCGMRHSTVAALQIVCVSSVLIVLSDGSPMIQLNVGKVKPALILSLVGILTVNILLFLLYYLCCIVVLSYQRSTCCCC